eukprot:TRINITY_DN6321_c0_g1_i1.p1 TRINITY_DN6321_c0_g1~~TRINITY_DN6321_c0_g1_i1.p1  ORF type:complete len:313 (-),score=42.69 TRINITY_DN6321_c0_g1_i1:730-1668(-)
MAHQPKQVTFGETKTKKFMIPTKKKYQNSSVVGVGYDFWRNYESSERRKLRDLHAKTHTLLALGRAVELRAAVEIYMSEPSLFPHVPVAPEPLVEQRPVAPNATAARVRRPAPPARRRSRSQSNPGGRQVSPANTTPAAESRPMGGRSESPEIPQVQVAETRRLFDDQDARVLRLQGERHHGSPPMDSEGDEDEDEDEDEDVHDVLIASPLQTTRDTSSSSHEGVATAQSSSSTGAEAASVSRRLTRNLVRAVTIADPSHVASIAEANGEPPLRPVPPSSSIERPRPYFPSYRRSGRSLTLPDMSSNHELEL